MVNDELILQESDGVVEQLSIVADRVFAALRKEYQEGPTTGVQLAPGDGAFLYRLLRDCAGFNI